MGRFRQEPAKVLSHFVGHEDHGIPTCWVTLEGDGWGQGFGGLCLREGEPQEFLREVMLALDTLDPERLVGTQVTAEWDSYDHPLTAIVGPTGKRFSIQDWRNGVRRGRSPASPPKEGGDR